MYNPTGTGKRGLHVDIDGNPVAKGSNASHQFRSAQLRLCFAASVTLNRPLRRCPAADTVEIWLHGVGVRDLPVPLAALGQTCGWGVTIGRCGISIESALRFDGGPAHICAEHWRFARWGPHLDRRSAPDGSVKAVRPDGTVAQDYDALGGGD